MNPAQKKAVDAARKIFSALEIRAGQSEKDIAKWLKCQLKILGAKPAFRIIVASGKRSVNPHACPTEKKIKVGEHVVVDFGALCQGYCSDITRTFFVGKPSKRQRKIYRIVKNAQLKAIKTVKAGVRCCEIDRVARDYIKQRCSVRCYVRQEKCPGDCFIHTTGHGIGRKVHQKPKISLKNRGRLKAGQVITIEPGIYIKGWGGMRIEDMVEVTRKGSRVLTS